MIQDISGPWRGLFDNGFVRTQLYFRLENEDGALTARLQTRALGELTLPVGRSDGELRFGVPALDIDLRLRPAGDLLCGSWWNSGVAFPVRFERGEPRPEPHGARPQTPRPPFPYAAEEISFTGADGSVLAGTMTRPPRPRGAVILSSWHGRVDRDQTIAGHKPLAIWADVLTRQGFLTLRYDKRGAGESGGDYDQAITADFAADLACALAWLRGRPEAAHLKIGLLGHSEGAHVSAEVAAADPAIAFCVMLTPAGVSEELTFDTELFRTARAVGGVPNRPDDKLRLVRSLMEAERRAETAEEAVERVRAALILDGQVHAERIEARALLAASPWRRYWMTYDQTASMAALACPALVVFAGCDLQAAPRRHAPSVRAALARNPRGETVELAGLNHALQTAITGAPSEYRIIEETIAPQVLITVCDWIERAVSPP